MQVLIALTVSCRRPRLGRQFKIIAFYALRNGTLSTREILVGGLGITNRRTQLQSVGEGVSEIDFGTIAFEITRICHPNR